jgi:hypothetical protein
MTFDQQTQSDGNRLTDRQRYQENKQQSHGFAPS